MTRSFENDPEFAALLALSVELGGDPLRTQAAGGNTSLKRDGIMWIKASGMWLADAQARQIMVPVRLDPLLNALNSGDERAEKCAAFVVEAQNPKGLRPSVETPVHAVIPRTVVVHIHCVATIAVSVRPDARDQLAERLKDIEGARWAFVPYVHPGVPLCHAIDATAAEANVIVLGNHGLIVAGDTVAEVAALVGQVSVALSVPVRPSPRPDIAVLARLAEGTPYRLPHDADL